MLTLDSLDVRNKRVLVRVDFNVPLSDDLEILDDSRIRAALPTIRHVLAHNGSCVLMSHLGRPKGEPDERLRLAPVAERLTELLPDHPVRSCPEVVGDQAREMAQGLAAGAVLLLENLRFRAEEKEGDEAFARELASLGEVYVNDAFAACHRRHASVYAVPRQFAADQRAAGLLVQREVEALTRVVENPKTPLVAIFGGAKVSDKVATVKALAARADRILIGGAMSYTLMKAQDQPVGDSKVEDDQLDTARQILHDAGDRLWLPSDHVVARSQGADPGGRLARDGIAEGWSGFDIGPETIARYRDEIAKAATVVWNGPMGKIEDDDYLEGTRKIAECVAACDATTVVGGGETAEVLRRLGLEDQVTHLSTGGGAFLEFVAHGTLPAFEVLQGE
ncbi:MAG: phosphoglycerate kinase [Pseudomonadales bacterium]